METLSIFKHKKQFSDSIDEVELLVNDCDFLVRVKYASMKTSKFYSYNNSTKARFEYTKICLFILS